MWRLLSEGRGELLPLEGGGWNATGLARQRRQSVARQQAS